MNPSDNPNWFANSPLERINHEEDQTGFIQAAQSDPKSLFIPLWCGDPLLTNDRATFLSSAARDAFPKNAPMVFLGIQNGAAHFGVDLSATSETPEAALFADLGVYTPIRLAAASISRGDLAIIGHARWLFEWHRKHPFCAVCGSATTIKNGGAKRQCDQCEAEHFPRTDPVAIVLAIHGDACLLGRSPQFPPGFLSALAGFIEAAETPEEAAKRELFEEAGVTLTNIRYQFSQPWPFPSSMMMGFLADAEDRELNLDQNEIEEARWVEIDDIKALLNGEDRHDIFLPPKFTIARQLIEHWVNDIDQH